MLRMPSKLVPLVVAAMSATVLMTAAPASAGDLYMLSTTGDSYGYYDDGNNRIVVCDLKSNDDKGATSRIHVPFVWNIGRTGVYNGCQEAGGIPDGQRVEMVVCDWIWSSAKQERIPSNCNTHQFTS